MAEKWVKRSQEEIKRIVFDALDQNVDYEDKMVLGVPASYLDEKVFNKDVSFLKDAPFLSALIHNPNHIGCHTLGKSEPFFRGTQAIEKELIEICAESILKGPSDQQDGYVAAGGTEANIQAIWVYRNYFANIHSALPSEITILCSADSHYSVDKAADLLGISIHKIPVDDTSREINEQGIEETIDLATSEDKKYFIVFCNMMTTMFGSVDDVDLYVKVLKNKSSVYKIHVDGAFGGFYYPFVDENSKLTFENPEITSFTLDAHKMAQAPYGTGIFLIRKGFIQYAGTEAGYVEGDDATLSGSRSGANAIAVWMILSKYGPYEWFEKILILQKRTDWFCHKLNGKGFSYYRNPMSNIVTLKADQISAQIATQFGLIPNTHENPSWYKVVVMEHVSIEKLSLLLDAI